MGPSDGSHVLLELQDRQEGLVPALLDFKSGSRQDLPVLQLDAVVDREPQTASQQDIEKSSGRGGG